MEGLRRNRLYFQAKLHTSIDRHFDSRRPFLSSSSVEETCLEKKENNIADIVHSITGLGIGKILIYFVEFVPICGYLQIYLLHYCSKQIGMLGSGKI